MRFKWIVPVATALTLLVSVPAVAEAEASTSSSRDAYSTQWSVAYSTNKNTSGNSTYRQMPYTTGRSPAYSSRPEPDNQVCVTLAGYRCPASHTPPVEPIVRPVPAEGGKYWIEPDYPIAGGSDRPITIQPIQPIRPEPKSVWDWLFRLLGW